MTTEAKAIILAGGLGTRLRPLTDTLPKCLVPIGGRPLLDYWVDRLAEAGVREARVNNHAHADQVRAYVAGVTASGRLKLVESYEPELLGSAGTIAANADLADGADVVVIIYADNFSDVDLKRMLAFHRSHDDPFTMLLFRAPNPSACGIAELDDEGRVVSFVEKPERAEKRPGQRRGLRRGRRRLPRDRRDGGVRPRLRGPAPVRRPDAGLGLGRLSPRRRHPRGPGEGPARRAPEDRWGEPGRSVFLDRDGTVIEQVHYLSDPAKVRLVPDAGPALRRLRDAGFALVVVTNQSAIGRGKMSVEQYEAVNAEMDRQLAAEGITLDADLLLPRGSRRRRPDRDHPRRPQAGPRDAPAGGRPTWGSTCRGRGWSAT